MGNLGKQDAITLACVFEELATAATLGALDGTTADLIGQALGAEDGAALGDELDRLAQSLRQAAGRE